MTQFYCPKSATVKLPSGRIFQMHRGVHHLPSELTNSMSAHDFGIKPTSEMTDAEWAALGLTKPVPKQAKPAAEKPAG